MPITTLHFVYNPNSGKKRGEELAARARKLCDERGVAFRAHPIENPKDTDRIARAAVEMAAREKSIVAAAGGDGTVRAVAHHAKFTDATVAVIPCGTFNLFARTHGIPEDAEAALEVALSGEVKRVRLADVNGETMILNASLGLYAKAIRERKASTRVFGRRRVVAVLSTLKTMLKGHPQMDLALEIDGRTEHVHTSMVFVGNNALQLRDLALKVAECASQNQLAVITLARLHKVEMGKLIFFGLRKKLESAESLESFCVDAMTIRSSHHRVEVALDGEIFTLSYPLAFKAMPEALRLLVPRGR